MRAICAFAAVLFLTSVTSPAYADGALKKFEGAHVAPPSSSSSSSSGGSSSDSKKSDSDSDSSSGGDSDSSSGGDSSSESGSGGGAWALVLGCATLVLGGLCAPPAKVAIAPYDGEDLYLRPSRDPATDATFYPSSTPIARSAELSLLGFAATNAKVYAHDLELRGWLGPVVGAAEWARLYEPLTRGGTDTLDLLRAHVGSNLLGPLVSRMELTPFVGASLLRGSAGVVGAFDAGAQARIYPLNPLTFDVSSVVSIYAVGPVLVDSRAEIGAVFGRLELRAGGRSLYQPGAQSLWGPVASVVLRF